MCPPPQPPSPPGIHGDHLQGPPPTKIRNTLSYSRILKLKILDIGPANVYHIKWSLGLMCLASREGDKCCLKSSRQGPMKYPECERSLSIGQHFFQVWCACDEVAISSARVTWPYMQSLSRSPPAPPLHGPSDSLSAAAAEVALAADGHAEPARALAGACGVWREVCWAAQSVELLGRGAAAT